MHSVHSWAQMVEQTLVIILFIEHSDMHIYVFPKKGGKEPCDDVDFHLLMWNIFFLWGVESLEAKIINAFKRVQIDFCQMKDNTCFFFFIQL